MYAGVYVCMYVSRQYDTHARKKRGCDGMRGMNEWLVVGGWERMDACMED